MKIGLRFTAVLFILFFSANLFAQKTFNEGVLTYNISIESAKGEKPVSSALNGAVLTVYLTKEKSRSEMKSTPGTEAAVFDNKANRGFILKEYSGQKLMITVTNDNWDQKNLSNKNLKFTTDAATSTIGSYTVKKAVAQSADGKTITVYYDPSVVIANKEYNNAFPQLAGLPVQYELSSGNLTFKYTLAGNSSEAIDDKRFDAPKSGYRVMTYEENQQLKKGE